MPTDDVTLALVVQKLDSLTAIVQEALAEQKEFERRLRYVETELRGLTERLTVWQLAQAGYSTIISAIAGIVSTLVRR